jgi:hypothetical protein
MREVSVTIKLKGKRKDTLERIKRYLSGRLDVRITLDEAAQAVLDTVLDNVEENYVSTDETPPTGA